MLLLFLSRTDVRTVMQDSIQSEKDERAKRGQRKNEGVLFGEQLICFSRIPAGRAQSIGSLKYAKAHLDQPGEGLSNAVKPVGR